MQKRIFLLTDGAVSDEKKVIQLIQEKCNSEIKVFALGIGNGCSRELLLESANAGKGTCNFAYDSNLT